MTTQAHVYKSTERSIIQSEIFSRYSIFNFDERNEGVLPFGILEALNDETLCPGNKVMRHVDQYMDIIIIPLSGTVVYKDSLGNKAIVETEQAGIFSVQEGMVYEIINMYEKSNVNYLQIWIKSDERNFNRQFRYKDFGNPEMNTLFPVFTGNKSQIPVLKTNSDSNGSIGVYNNGQGGRYVLKSPSYGLFAFVINGTFEFEGRKLQSRDAISFNGISGAAYSALTENAAILLLEIPF